jgi:hypothetical protein
MDHGVSFGGPAFPHAAPHVQPPGRSEGEPPCVAGAAEQDGRLGIGHADTLMMSGMT